MSIFDEQAVEAAARKIAVAAGRKEHDWAAFRVHAGIALHAAEASSLERGKLQFTYDNEFKCQVAIFLLEPKP